VVGENCKRDASEYVLSENTDQVKGDMMAGMWSSREDRGCSSESQNYHMVSKMDL
jgi:hypothetical protein